MPKIYFDERIAKGYDAATDVFEPAVVDPAVNFLADLAREGAALELGIGTGRIALPLSRRGVRVRGIDLSPAMVEQLRAKPGADDIGVTIGDFATTRPPAGYAVRARPTRATHTCSRQGFEYDAQGVRAIGHNCSFTRKVVVIMASRWR